MTRRYKVEPIDNHGTLDGPPRQRTWGVIDRQTGEHIEEWDTRAEARQRRDTMNSNADPGEGEG